LFTPDHTPETVPAVVVDLKVGYSAAVFLVATEPFKN
jgi:hypothetical protein